MMINYLCNPHLHRIQITPWRCYPSTVALSGARYWRCLSAMKNKHIGIGPKKPYQSSST